MKNKESTLCEIALSAYRLAQEENELIRLLLTALAAGIKSWSSGNLPTRKQFDAMKQSMTEAQRKLPALSQTLDKLVRDVAFLTPSKIDA